MFRLPPEIEEENEITALMRDLNWMVRVIEVRESELERRVARRTDELNQARLVAEASVQAKGEFLANISHEIRTPINAIMGMAEVLVIQPESPSAGENLRIIAAASKSLLTLVNEILDYSKMEAGKMKLEAVPFRLRDIMEGVTDTLSQLAQEKRIELVCDMDASVPQTLIGDPTRLGQIITNLTANAIRFTDAGEVLITARFSRETLGKGELSLCVSDTGEGIPPDLLPILFDAFTQADSSTTRQYGGTGLGLAICQKLSVMMHGVLSVASVQGQGSEFTLTCPLALPCISTDPPQYKGIHKPRCLLVDDNPTARRVLSGFLDDFGFPYGAEGTVAGAVDVLACPGAGYRLLLVDVTLPPGEVALLIRHLQAMQETDRPRVILLSPLNNRDTEWHRSLDIAGHAVKPVKQSALYNVIVSALAPDPAPPREISGGETAVAAGPRVLVVEDNPFNQKVATEILGAAQFQVQCVDNGHGALDLLTHTPFDLVLVDMQMPGMDGCQVTEAIRATQGLEFLPVVMLTADADPETRRAAMAAGASGFLTKPVDPRELLRVLAGHLSASRCVLFPGQAPGSGHFIDQLATALGGKRTLAMELLKGFIDTFKETPAGIRQALDADAPEEAMRLLHTLKGAAATLYCHGLAKGAGTMELALKAGRCDEARAGVFSLDQRMYALGCEASSLSQGAAEAGADLLTDDLLGSGLGELEVLITKRNITARAKALELKQSLCLAGFEPQAEQLVACLRKYNFKDALGLLSQMRTAGSSCPQHSKGD